MLKFCQICNKEIHERRVRRHALYCSSKCSKKAKSIADKNKYDSWPMGRRADRGALSELLAAADLLKHGFEVYRNVSPHGSSDLIIKKNNQFLSIEVRTARRKINGGFSYPKQNLRSNITALVFKDTVVYEPQEWAEKAGLGFKLEAA